MRTHRGAWVGWPGSPDDDIEPFTHNDLQLEPVHLSAEDVELYYEGFSNGTLWPLYHDVVAPPAYHREWWDRYVTVNERFAEAAARGRRARAVRSGSRTTSSSSCRRCCGSSDPTCGSGSSCTSRSRPPSCSSSCPGAARSCRDCSAPTWSASSCPAAPRTSSGWCGSGFSYETRRDRIRTPDGRTVIARAYPIAIDSRSMHELAMADSTAERAREIRADLGDPKTIFLGVDRLDYTKGLPERIRAFGELVADGTIDPEEAVFLQVATPSRERVEQYRHAPRRHRPAGRPDQRRHRPDRSAADHLPAHLLPAGGDGGPVPGGRRHGRHPAARRDEPGGQGVRGLPGRRQRRAGAERVRRRRARSCARPTWSTRTTSTG